MPKEGAGSPGSCSSCGGRFFIRLPYSGRFEPKMINIDSILFCIDFNNSEHGKDTRMLTTMYLDGKKLKWIRTLQGKTQRALSHHVHDLALRDEREEREVPPAHASQTSTRPQSGTHRTRERRLGISGRNIHGPVSSAERITLCLRVSSEEQRDRETIEIQRDFLQNTAASTEWR